jgi:hypothetical protein
MMALLDNAGIIGPRGPTVGNIDYQTSAEVLAVNTMGSYAGVRSFCRACGPERSQA